MLRKNSSASFVICNDIFTNFINNFLKFIINKPNKICELVTENLPLLTVHHPLSFQKGSLELFAIGDGAYHELTNIGVYFLLQC
jgi:hypothetical protein